MNNLFNLISETLQKKHLKKFLILAKQTNKKSCTSRTLIFVCLPSGTNWITV